MMDLPSPNKSPVSCVVHIWVFTLEIAVEREEIIFSKPGTEASGEAFNIVCTSVFDFRSKGPSFAVYPSIIDCFAEPKGSELFTVSEESIFSIELIITCICAARASTFSAVWYWDDVLSPPADLISSMGS